MATRPGTQQTRDQIKGPYTDPYAGGSLGSYGYQGSSSGGSASTRGYGAGPVVTAGSGMSADDTLANLYRSEWNEYLRLFPKYDKLMVELGMGTEDNEQAIARARESADDAFESSRGTYQRNMSRYRINEEPDEKAARERQESRNLMSARATAGNQARIHTRDRDTALLGGNLSVGLQDAEFMGGGA